MKTTNYFNTLILISDDSPVSKGVLPPDKKEKTIAAMQYDMMAQRPYKFTSDDVIFGVFADRNDIPERGRAAAREQFFSKGQACFRASALPKKYGWGIHSNAEGKVALVDAGSEAYEKMRADENVAKVKAMRSSKK